MSWAQPISGRRTYAAPVPTSEVGLTCNLSTVLTCSALKRSHRSLLSQAQGRVAFLHPDGDPLLLAERMRGRQGHFMPTTRLPSQLAALEPLEAEELEAGSMRLNIAESPAQLVQVVLEKLRLCP
jgi:gluconokinase